MKKQNRHWWLPRLGIRGAADTLPCPRSKDSESRNIRLREAGEMRRDARLRKACNSVYPAGLVLALGLVIAFASTAFLARLERNSEKQKARAEQAENELRRLSNQLVRVQEDERFRRTLKSNETSLPRDVNRSDHIYCSPNIRRYDK